MSRLIDWCIPPVTFVATLALCTLSLDYKPVWAAAVAAGMAAISAVIPILSAMKQSESDGP